MIFDCIIGNPPYNGKGEKTYLKIMNKCIDFSKKSVFIVPTDFIDNPNIKENVNGKHVEKLNTKFESFSRLKTKFNDQKFNETFFFSDIGIFTFESKKIDLYDIRFEKFSNPQLYKKIIGIIDNYFKNNKSIADIQGIDNKYYVQLSEIRGHAGCWDWPTLLSKSRYNILTKRPIETVRYDNQYIAFNSELECKNFIDYCNLDTVMFLNYCYKFNQHTRYNNIPALDFNNKYTDDDICNIIGLTKYKQFILDEMKEYGYKVKK